MKFAEKVLELTKKIPAGRVTTYKEMAHAIGTKSYRAVGSALHNNDMPVVIPCHRVVNSDGKLGGYAFGMKKKKALLKKEGIIFCGDMKVDLKRCFHRF